MIQLPPPQPAPSAWVVTARGDSLSIDHVTQVVNSSARNALLLTLRVPERRGSGSSPTATRRITLRAVRFPALSEKPGAPIVFLAGGPGDAGTRAVSTMPTALLDSLRILGDVIAFDQRGTGGSEPRLACMSTAIAPTLRLTRATRDSAAAADASRCVTQLAVAGVDIRGWTTRESAEDLESLRIALGAPRLSLLGGSYGTHLGLAYIGAYDARVSRAVLAGVEGPDDTFKLPSRIDEVFATFAAQVDADSTRRNRPSMLATFDSLRARLERAPADVAAGTTTVVVDGSTVQRFITDALGDARAMRQLPAQLDAMAGGDLTPLARTELRRRQGRMLDGMNLLMNCASGATAARRARIAQEATRSRLGDVMDAPTPAMCDAIAVQFPMHAPALPDRMTASVLFVSGTWDGRTPAANVEPLLPRFRNGRHLVLEQASHGLMGDPDGWRAMMQFLGGRDVPSGVVRRPAPTFGR